jgi:hypothetical protein
MSVARAIDVVLPDSGPLISLAKADRLDLLLRFKSQVRILVADLVAYEVTHHANRFEDARAIKEFLDAHRDRIKVTPTVVGDNHIRQAQLREAYEQAGSEERAAVDRIGLTPRKPRRGEGEVAILAVARQIGREHPDDAMLVLAEDQYFLSRGKFAEPHTHILSTRAFLEELGRRHIIDFDAVWSAIVVKRPEVNNQSIDRPAPNIRTNWRSALTDFER